MASKVSKKINLPPRGFIQQIAQIVGCSRHTVRRALYENARGITAEKCRQVYLKKFAEHENA